MNLLNEFGNKVDLRVEEMSRILCRKYIHVDDNVLELGARYGSVSCYVNTLLTDPAKQYVVVEPDPAVKDCLLSNRDSNNCTFNIINGVISKDPQYVVKYPCIWEQKTFKSVPSDVKSPIFKVNNYTLTEIQDKFNLKFNVLVADCEGFLIEFFEDNKEFIKNLNLIIYEEDCVKHHPIDGRWVDYEPLEQFLIENGFSLVADLKDNIQLSNKVWSKANESLG